MILIQGANDLGMLGWRQVTPEWENDPVWLQDGQKRREVRGMSG